MGILAWLFVEAARDTAKEAYNSAANVTYTVTAAVKDGFCAAADRASTLAAAIVPAMSSSQEDLLRQRQEARRLGLGAQVKTLTPEERFQQEKLVEFRNEAREMIAILDDEITDLKESTLHLFYNSKIFTKRIKRDELDAICHARDWAGMQRQAAQALNNKKVVTGRHSRTQAFFLKITKTCFSNPANTETLESGQAVVSQQTPRRA